MRMSVSWKYLTGISVPCRKSTGRLPITRTLSNGRGKESALLSALKPGSFSQESSKSKKNVRHKIKSVNHPTKKTKPKTSFFDEVDKFLEEESRNKESSSFRSNKFFDKASSSKTTEDSVDSNTWNDTSRKWTSYLPKSENQELSSGKSIFDVFKVPEPPPERSPNAFDLDAYESYCALLDFEIADEGDKSPNEKSVKITEEMKRDVILWLRREECQVPIQLPTLVQFFKDNSSTSVDILRCSVDFKKKVEAEARKQEKLFVGQLNWNRDQYMYATKVLRRLAKGSSENHKALPVVVIWEKIKETGYLRQQIVGLCLNAATSFSAAPLSRNRSSLVSLASSGSISSKLWEKDDEESAEEASEDTATVPEQLAITHDLLYQPTKQTTSIQMRRLLGLRDAKGSLELVETRMEGQEMPRAYIPVFRLFIELGDIDSAFLLFEKMKQNHDTVAVEPESFVQLISGAGENGFFRTDSKELPNGTKLGYSPACGPAFFDQLAEEMSKYAVSISSASAKRMQRALLTGFSDERVSRSSISTSYLAPLKPMNELVGDDTVILDRVSVDPTNGECPRSGVNLRLIGLEPEQKASTKRSLLSLLEPELESKTKGDDRHTRAMHSFWNWLDTRTGDPFTVIVDGANVAYYMQNFDRGKFNFHQIKFVVTALQHIGENPLVILPRKYQHQSFYVTLGSSSMKQTANQKDRAVLSELKGRLWWTSGTIDDYFWIGASLSDQSASRKNVDLHVSHEEGGRWPGSRPVVLTNDQIRDHKVGLMEPKLFNRWYSNTIVNYNFTGFVDDECIDPEIGFSPADFFSREIQMNKSGGGNAWHFPVHDWESTDWFCVRIPSTTSRR